MNEQIKKYGIGKACSTDGRDKKSYEMSVGETEGKNPTRRADCA
jgi:hypothetical protein